MCSKHDVCNQWPRIANTEDCLPMRLLEIEAASDTPRIRLIHTDSLSPRKVSYATLSHCWGNRLPIRLTMEDMALFSIEIDWDSLPKTFQEAVCATVRLGLNYIWIDVGHRRARGSGLQSEGLANSSFEKGTLYYPRQ